MVIEHQFCDICGNDMGHHMVEKEKPDYVVRVCKAHTNEEVDLYMAKKKFDAATDRVQSNLDKSLKNLQAL